jgi:hypothetical protein
VGVCGRGCVGVGVCGGFVGGGYSLANQNLANEQHISNIAMCTTMHMRMGACVCEGSRWLCMWMGV